MNKQFQEILQKELSRKEFLQYVGSALLAILGISSLLKNLLTGFGVNKQSSAPSYGGSTYGGKRKNFA